MGQASSRRAFGAAGWLALLLLAAAPALARAVTADPDVEYRQSRLIYAANQLPAGRNAQSGKIAPLKGADILRCEPDIQDSVCRARVPDIALWAERRLRGQDQAGAPSLKEVERAVARLAPAAPCPPQTMGDRVGPQWFDARPDTPEHVREIYLVPRSACGWRALGFYRYLYFASLYAATAPAGERAAAAASIARMKTYARAGASFDPTCGAWSSQPPKATCELLTHDAAVAALRTASDALLTEAAGERPQRVATPPAASSALYDAPTSQLWPDLNGGAQEIFMAAALARGDVSADELTEQCRYLTPPPDYTPSPSPDFWEAIDLLAARIAHRGCPGQD